MADVGGTLAFDDIPRPHLPTMTLPAFIPQTDGSSITNGLDAHLAWPAYGVGLRRIFSPDSHSLYPRWKGRTAADVVGLSTEQKVVLIGYGEDPLVEAFWTARHRDGLLDAIADQGWDLVLAPNYSIYGNWPRSEHLLNMRRSQLIATELLDRGVPAVVNAYWFRVEDLARWVAWAQDVTAPAIAINLQTVRDTKGWDTWAEPGLHYLAAYLPTTTTVILTGLSRPDRIAAAVALFGDRLILVSQNPYQYALHGAVIGPTGRDDVHARVPDAFASSVRYMASLLPHTSTRIGDP